MTGRLGTVAEPCCTAEWPLDIAGPELTANSASTATEPPAGLNWRTGAQLTGTESCPARLLVLVARGEGSLAAIPAPVAGKTAILHEPRNLGALAVVAAECAADAADTGFAGIAAAGAGLPSTALRQHGFEHLFVAWQVTVLMLILARAGLATVLGNSPSLATQHQNGYHRAETEAMIWRGPRPASTDRLPMPDCSHQKCAHKTHEPHRERRVYRQQIDDHQPLNLC